MAGHRWPAGSPHINQAACYLPVGTPIIFVVWNEMVSQRQIAGDLTVGGDNDLQADLLYPTHDHRLYVEPGRFVKLVSFRWTLAGSLAGNNNSVPGTR